MGKEKVVLRDTSPSNYDITGYYYHESGYNFRKYLNIRLKDFDGMNPDLMVIMMNPGSSFPLNGDNNGRYETEAKPDRTQTQIMRVMEGVGFRYARVLNLSDLREPKSSIFYKKISLMDSNGIDHSIFMDNRNGDLNKLYRKGVPVIYGWGVNAKLRELASKVMEITSEENSIGLNKTNHDHAFYHPLPRRYQKQKDWYEGIEERLSKFK